jgi:hypothetical protein
MGLAHKHRPHYGVQFHPESIATRYGIQVLINFRDLAYQHCKQQVPLALQGIMGVGPPGHGREVTPRPWLGGRKGEKGLGANQQEQQQQQQQRGIMSGGRGVSGMVLGAMGACKEEQQQRLVQQYQQQQQQQREDQLPPSPAADEAVGSVTLQEALASAVPDPPPPGTLGAARAAAPAAAAAAPAVTGLHVSWRHLPGVLEQLGGSQALFEQLVGPQEDSFWLDR